MTVNYAEIPLGEVSLSADIASPRESRGVVVFAHGSGSGRFSPRNRSVASTLQEGGLSTVLVDLLTDEESEADAYNAQLRFDILLLTRRLVGVIDWLSYQSTSIQGALGVFGASTGAAAALAAAAERPEEVRAVVSRGGRPDLALDAVAGVRAPTLLIVGSRDEQVLELNRMVLPLLNTDKHLEIVPGASHLFEEPGALEHVAHLARTWFTNHLTQPQ